MPRTTFSTVWNPIGLLAFLLLPYPLLAQGPLTNGDNHSGSILAPGEVDSWTFQASAGNAISVSIGELTDTSNGSFLPRIRLRAPDGAQLAASWGHLTGHITVASAPQTGTYTVLVDTGDGPGNGTGTYRLTLALTPGAFVVPGGDEGGPMTNVANHTGTIHVGDLDQWTFQANTGNAISVSIGELTDTSNGSFLPFIRLRAPDGTQLAASWGHLTGHITVASAPQTGTYTVLVGTADGSGNGTGTYRLTLALTPGDFIVPTGDEGGPLGLGAGNEGTIHLADLDQWTLIANAGSTITVS
ncbi:MAG: hypothetical protein IT581_23185, partial [Verrucomicrobiales bacterium]|nr:hypothetical protein [Verrucomicrobiales bacterium]